MFVCLLQLESNWRTTARWTSGHYLAAKPGFYYLAEVRACNNVLEVCIERQPWIVCSGFYPINYVMIDWIQLSNVQILTSQGIIALAETAHWIKVCRPLVERHPTLISRRPPTQQRPPTPPHCHPPMFPAPKTATAKELYNSTLRQQVARYRRDRERWPRRGKTVRLENPGFPCNNSDPYRSLYQCHQHLKQQKWALRCTTTISGKTDRQTFRYFPSWTSWGCLPPGSTCAHLWYHMRHAAIFC